MAGAGGRTLWFQVHKWLGLILFVILIPLSASGSLLVWDHWTDSIVNPQRYELSDGEGALSADAYVASARRVLAPTARMSAIEFPQSRGNPVLVTAAPKPVPGEKQPPGPPSRRQVWLDPASGAVLDQADSRSGILRVLHVFHGSLMIRDWGRPIVRWLGVAMLLSCISGVWLWWPAIGGMLRGFRWKRGSLTSGNLHHQIGIWIAVPLAVLSFTGVYISFPTFFRSIEAIGSAAKESGRSSGPDRRAGPIAETRLDPNRVLDAVLARQPGTSVKALRWPTEKTPDWTVVVDEQGTNRTYLVGDRDGRVAAAPESGGGMARMMRQLHDGHEYNLLWQTIIFLGGLAPLALGITGVIMWLRTRGWRKQVAVRRRRHAR